MDLSFIPRLNAILNATGAILLICGYLAIKRGRRDIHRAFMLGAVITSGVFLTGYLVYHAHHGATRYPGQGLQRTIYFAVLLTHTVMAGAILPLIGMVLYRAFRGRFERHRRLARWTLPAWLYVSITGIIVYLMLYGWS